VNEAKTEIAAAFGLALKEARANVKMSQEALALESGIDRTFVSMLERGIRQPALSTVFALCAVLAVKPGALVARAAELMKPARRRDKIK